MPLDEFLLTRAPGSSAALKESATKLASTASGNAYRFVWPPTLLLPCQSGKPCRGLQVFALAREAVPLVEASVRAWASGTGIVSYKCKNCEISTRSFAVMVMAKTAGDGSPVPYIHKIGEIPAFGGPLPQRLLELAGAAADYLRKGHSAEAQGLGIGAFAYYRRFVDLQKNRLFQRIIEVAELEAGNEELIEDLRAAKQKHRFAESMKAISHALPSPLTVRGQNPLSLLYGALSVNLHGKSDQDCLQLATDVRVVLAELAQRLANALADDEELKSAVVRLAEAQSRKRKSPK